MVGSEDARLYWQCRRGMRELDLLLQGFLERDYNALSQTGRLAFARLLTYPDALLLEYLLGRLSPSEPELADVVARIRSTAAS